MSILVDDSPNYELARIVETQKAFFSSGKTRSTDFRRARLRDLEAAITSRGEEMLEALASDLGKPALEAYLSEIYFLLSEIRFFLKKLPAWSSPRRVGNPFYFFPARSEIRQEPYGVALIAAPWNYPFQLSIGPLIAAVGAGNCVVLKPSELAPSSADLLAAIIAEVFEPGHVTVVKGGAETASTLLGLPFDFWFYTGSERVGRLYAGAAAAALAPIVLELGGKCPCVVDSDVDLETTVARIAVAKFFNAGQTCIAPDFVLVPEPMREAFVARMRAHLEVSYGEGNTGDLATIVNENHYHRLLALATPDAICIGEDDTVARRLAPRLLPDAGWDSPAMQEEIFGPVLPVIGYKTLGEALERLSRLPSPLALYAFSRNRKTLERIAASIRSGSVCFNDAVKQATNLRLPFGGVGASGIGRYRGRAGFETFSYSRSVMRRYFFPDLFLTKPPYGDKLERLRKMLR